MKGTSRGAAIPQDIRGQVRRVTTMRMEKHFMFIDLRLERLLPAFAWLPLKVVVPTLFPEISQPGNVQHSFVDLVDKWTRENA